MNDTVSKVAELQLEMPASPQGDVVPGNSPLSATAWVESADTADKSDETTDIAITDEEVSPSDTARRDTTAGEVAVADNTSNDEGRRLESSDEVVAKEPRVSDELSLEMARLAEAEAEMVQMVATYEANVAKREARDMAEEDVRTTAAVIFSSGYDFQLTYEPYKQRFGWIAY